MMKHPQSISLNIHEVHQTSSWDHVTIFRAEVELLPRQNAVELETVNIDSMSDILDPSEVLEVLEHIRQGVIAVVRPRGIGAYVIVSDFRIHEIDFKARMFERYTREYLERALVAQDQADGTGDEPL